MTRRREWRQKWGLEPTCQLALLKVAKSPWRCGKALEPGRGTGVRKAHFIAVTTGCQLAKIYDALKSHFYMLGD